MTTATKERFGSWMQTYTGRQFWPLDPRIEEIDILDIAASLSMQCRYAGHTNQFYSVAEHCVLMSEAVSPENALAALLHDAAEAYVIDVPRPLKRHLLGYKEIEHRVADLIAKKYGLASDDWPAEVHEADNRILCDEKATLMAAGLRWETDIYQPLGVRIVGWSPSLANHAYLSRFVELTS